MKTTKTKALVKFDFDVAVITALDARYADIQTAEGTKPYALVMKGLSEYREIRLAIDVKHKEYKKDILEAGRSLDGDKNRLKALIQPGENRLRDLKNAEDDRKDAIKAEKEAKERERIEAIQEKINSIRSLGEVHNVPSLAIQDRLTLTRGIEISEEVYQEFTEQAIKSQKDAILILEETLTLRLQFEKEEVERKAEAERLETQRKAQEAAQAKIAEANKEIEEEKKRLKREEFERQNKKEVQKLADKWAKDKADREEAEAKEKERQEAMAPDKEKLIKLSDEIYDIQCPVLKSTKAQKISDNAREILGGLAQEVRAKAKKL